MTINSGGTLLWNSPVSGAYVNNSGTIRVNTLATLGSSSAGVVALSGGGVITLAGGTFGGMPAQTGRTRDWVTSVDFNGDGKLDLAVANGGDTVSVLLRNGDGTFQPHQQYGTGDAPISVAVADFNGNGQCT